MILCSIEEAKIYADLNDLIVSSITATYLEFYGRHMDKVKYPIFNKVYKFEGYEYKIYAEKGQYKIIKHDNAFVLIKNGHLTEYNTFKEAYLNLRK